MNTQTGQVKTGKKNFWWIEVINFEGVGKQYFQWPKSKIYNSSYKIPIIKRGGGHVLLLEAFCRKKSLSDSLNSGQDEFSNISGSIASLLEEKMWSQVFVSEW